MTADSPDNLRLARLEDVPELERLIALSATQLSRGFYSDTQVEAALGNALGVDRELIGDGTYFVIERAGEAVACGGWSRRRTLFGADGNPGRESALLDPATEAARIRAFFVHPDHARRGLGRRLLEVCESAARAAGFREAALMATLPGERLYSVCGYESGGRVSHALPSGVVLELVPMHKSLV